MKVLELKLSEPTFAKLEEAAARLNMSPEQLAVLSLVEQFEEIDARLKTDAQFRSAADYVLDKNAELHKRLA
jgi:hypothetical protein